MAKTLEIQPCSQLLSLRIQMSNFDLATDQIEDKIILASPSMCRFEALANDTFVMVVDGRSYVFNDVATNEYKIQGAGSAAAGLDNIMGLL
jgi:hypothetical protein